MSKTKHTPQTVSLSPDSLPDGHIQITISGPPEHVRAALRDMSFTSRAKVPVTIVLCDDIAFAAAKRPDAQEASTLESLEIESPAARDAYAGRCVLALNDATGVAISRAAFPHEETTTIHEVAIGMFKASAHA